ncbi:MAG: DUF1761 domain-containing protein [Chlamydiota bacterium]
MIAVDLLTVTVAAFLAFLVGIVWFSPFLFGKAIQLSVSKWKGNLILFITLWVSSYFLAIMESALGATSFWDGVCAGITVWLGFVLTTHSYSFWGREKKVGRFWVEQGFFFLAYLLIGGVLAG